MICFPNAKINIGLNIISKREDNYHDIETVFYPVALCDVLEVVESSELSFHLSGLNIEGNMESNLCIKAYNLLKERFDISPVDIYLHKVIPTGAGLGGGSSDAAFMLKTLNTLFGLKLSVNELEIYASQLGSDCAFFIKNKPVFAFEKGDIFQDINLSLKGKYITILKPNIHINTAEAYSMVLPFAPIFNLRNLSDLLIGSWKSKIVNNFQEGAVTRYPLIGELINKLYANGAFYAAMSGSGSAVFGVFDKEQVVEKKYPGHFVWSGKLA